MAAHRNSLLLVTASGIAASGIPHAQAAPPDAATWAGWYAGLNVNVTQHSASETDVNGWGNGSPASYVTPFFSSRHTDGGLGGQLGYNWQFNNIVLGGETDLDWVATRTTFQPPMSLVNCGPCAASATNELNWMATFRARAGYAVDNVLLFGTLGLALGGINDHWGFGLTGGGVRVFSDSQFSSSGTRSGFIYGGGVEYALNARWRVRADLMHVDFGTTSATFTGTCVFCGASATYTTNFHNSATLGHLALSYRW